ncbi:MAG: aryl-sulfate sulfotransferase [Alphaproteobacteria bacterium]|nr:aryl-sulfate sulfotransferase [Alphaproteobacteria bacterium]
MKKRSVRISGHNTSITLEEPFWYELKRLACAQKKSVNALVSEIDNTQRGKFDYNLSSAVRIYILNDLLRRLSQ